MKVHMRRVLCVECVTRVECGAMEARKEGTSACESKAQFEEKAAWTEKHK
jgi:hypothetical protein